MGRGERVDSAEEGDAEILHAPAERIVELATACTVASVFRTRWWSSRIRSSWRSSARRRSVRSRRIFRYPCGLPVAQQGHQQALREEAVCRPCGRASARPRPSLVRAPAHLLVGRSRRAVLRGPEKAGCPARRSRPLVSEHVLCPGVPARDPAVQVDGEDRVVRRAFDDHAVSLLAGAQRFVGIAHAHERAHGGEKFARLDRLDEIGVGAVLETARPVFALDEGSRTSAAPRSSGMSCFRMRQTSMPLMSGSFTSSTASGGRTS